MTRRARGPWLPGAWLATAGLVLCGGCGEAPEVAVRVPDSAPSRPSTRPPTPAPTPAPSGSPTGAGGGAVAGPDVVGAVAVDEVYTVPDQPVVAPALPRYELQVRRPPLSGEEAAVLDAWESFWQRIAEGSGVPEHRPGPMGAVASGRALVDAERYVTGLVDAQRRVTGRLVVVADVVEVDGATAVVSGCSDQRDHEVDAGGADVSAPEGRSDLSTELVREDDRWRVSLWGVRGPC